MTESVNANYCQYVEGICDKTPRVQIPSSLFAVYPSKPESSAEAIEGAMELIREEKNLDVPVSSWKELPIEGNLIFCEICKAIREASCTLANVTGANFNVLFEYGFAIGMGKAIWPIVEQGISKRDQSYSNIGWH